MTPFYRGWPGDRAADFQETLACAADTFNHIQRKRRFAALPHRMLQGCNTPIFAAVQPVSSRLYVLVFFLRRSRQQAIKAVSSRTNRWRWQASVAADFSLFGCQQPNIAIVAAACAVYDDNNQLVCRRESWLPSPSGNPRPRASRRGWHSDVDSSGWVAISIPVTTTARLTRSRSTPSARGDFLR